MRFHTQTAGVLADRPAAAEQHRPHRDRGAGRRARRHPVAAHQLLRRGARAADRGRRADRAAHAADHRPRDRRDQHDRPARRLLLRRGADRPLEAQAYEYFAKIDELGGMVEAVKRNYPQREIADAAFELQAQHRRRRARRRRRQPLHRGRRRRDAAAAHRPGARAQADRPRSRPSARGATAPRSSAARRAAQRRRDRGEPDAAAARRAPARTRPRARSSRRSRHVWGAYTETPVF